MRRLWAAAMARPLLLTDAERRRLVVAVKASRKDPRGCTAAKLRRAARLVNKCSLRTVQREIKKAGYIWRVRRPKSGRSREERKERVGEGKERKDEEGKERKKGREERRREEKRTGGEKTREKGEEGRGGREMTLGTDAHGKLATDEHAGAPSAGPGTTATPASRLWHAGGEGAVEARERASRLGQHAVERQGLALAPLSPRVSLRLGGRRPEDGRPQGAAEADLQGPGAAPIVGHRAGAGDRAAVLYRRLAGNGPARREHAGVPHRRTGERSFREPRGLPRGAQLAPAGGRRSRASDVDVDAHDREAQGALAPAPAALWRLGAGRGRPKERRGQQRQGRKQQEKSARGKAGGRAGLEAWNLLKRELAVRVAGSKRWRDGQRFTKKAGLEWHKFVLASFRASIRRNRQTLLKLGSSMPRRMRDLRKAAGGSVRW